MNIVQESPLTHDTHLPPPTHRPSHLSPTLPTCSSRMPPGHPLERTSGGTDWTPRARIGNCGFRPGRTSPTDDCTQTPVACGKTQSSIKKYVLDQTQRSATAPDLPPHPAQAGVAPRNVTAAAESIRRSVTDKLADGFYMTTALTLRPGEDVLSA